MQVYYVVHTRLSKTHKTRKLRKAKSKKQNNKFSMLLLTMNHRKELYGEGGFFFLCMFIFFLDTESHSVV